MAFFVCSLSRGDDNDSLSNEQAEHRGVVKSRNVQICLCSILLEKKKSDSLKYVDGVGAFKLYVVLWNSIIFMDCVSDIIFWHPIF